MKRYILILSYVLIAGFAMGQIPNYIPPSPNAAALVKSVDVQVGEYTGVPNISLPLYTIKSGDLSLPITLDYHASGIKVEQEASWVGLGWSLNAGGCITRQIRGKDDFRPNLNGYISLDNLPPSTDTNLPQWGTSQANDGYFNYYTNVANGSYDGEPDMFYYNFNGKSGKLVFEKQSGTIVRAISLSQNSIKFTYNILSQIWEVIDENGVKYSFMTAEESKNYSHSGNTRYEQSTCFEEIDGDTDTKITAWYLNKIESPSGNSISFDYDSNTNQTLTQVQRSELVYKLYDLKLIKAEGKGYISPNLSGYTEIHTASMQETYQVWLKSINFANGSLKFTTSDRTDLVSRNSNKPQKLENIEIYDKNNTLIKTFDFNYSYFNENQGTADSERLKLNSVQEFAGGKSIPAYEFSYNSVNLPPKTSFSQDHWGFYNGKNNESICQYELISVINHLNNVYGVPIDSQYGTVCKKTLIPYKEEKNENNDVFINGANREPDPLSMQAATLTKIKYPTGGSTDFEYEPNQYQSLNTTKDTTIYSSVVFYRNNGGMETSINLDQNTFLYLDYQLIEYEYGTPNTYYSVNAELRNADNNGSKIIEFLPSSNRFESHIVVCLPPGRYSLYVNSPDDQYDYQEIKATYKKKIPITKEIGGGLRIHRVINKNESQAITNTENYTYEDLGTSTGKLMSPLMYYHTETVLNTQHIIQPGNIITYIYQGNYLVQASNSFIPLGNSAQGNPVGYDKVIKNQTSTTGTANGKTVSSFWNTPDDLAFYFMPGVPNHIHNDNGLLKLQEIYDSNNYLLIRKTNSYVKNSNTSLNPKGIKIHKFIYGDNGVQIRFYDNNSEWWYMSSETTDTYSPGGSTNYVRTTNNYYYDNSTHKLLTRKNTLRSDNILVSTKIKYPSDINTDNYSSMSTLNMLNYPIEETTLVNGSVTTSKLTTYKANSNGYVPDKVYSFETTTPLAASSFTTFNGTTKDARYGSTPELSYDEYNTNGTVRQLTGRDGITTAYLWDATGSYPMAQVKGATWQQVSAYNGQAATTDSQTLFNNINSLVPNAFTTTFTYKPLYGLSSQTDPAGRKTSYEYDDFGRLKLVKDLQGNIVKKMEYHYAGQ